MANIIQRKYDARAALTISLGGLANGSGQQSTIVTGNVRPGALVFCKIESSGSAPTAGTVYEVYLIRGNGTERDDNAGASDAAITIENAPLLGTIIVTASTNKNFYGVFDTAALGVLGTEWGIAVKNSTGQSLNATGGNHVIAYQTYYDEIQ